MKRKILLFSLLMFIKICAVGQTDLQILNGLKYAYVPKFLYGNDLDDVYGISNFIKEILTEKGIIILSNEVENWPKEARINSCLIGFWYTSLTGSQKLTVTVKNCKKEIVYENSKSAALNWTNEFGSNLRRALGRTLKPLQAVDYQFDEKYTPEIIYPDVEKSTESEFSLKNYLSSNTIDQIEGIYKSIESGASGFYKLGIKKYGDTYKVIVIESDLKWWKVGDVKGYLELTAIGNVYSSKWLRNDKTSTDALVELKNESLLNITYTGNSGNEIKMSFIKLFPNSKQITQSNKNEKAYGSGFIITREGIIATNAHVIENANKISVKITDETSTADYNAKVLLIDKKNDVALIKIIDTVFKGFPTIPYSLVENADIGEKVFTIGFPLNNIMGSNYKVNDGIISSNTGISDDVRYFQISVPLQPGNSGGPLFNKDGNVIGITSSKLNSEAVGTEVQNVNYAIKSSYLLNLFNMLPNSPNLSSNHRLVGMEMQDQVKVLKYFVCLISVN